MGKNKESDQKNNGNKKGLQLDPGFVSLEAEGDLDYSRVSQDKNLELWLLQIPLDFPLDENVVWRATEPGSGRISAITEIEDAGYRLVEEQETGQAPIYAIGGANENPQPAKVTRRVNIVKRTDAQKVCFGIEDADILEDVDARLTCPTPAPAATPGAATPSKDKAAKKEEKKKKREETSAEPDTEQKKKKSKKK